MGIESLPVAKNFRQLSINNRQLIWKILGLGISILIAIYLLKQVDLSQFIARVKGVPAGSLVAAFAVYMLLNFFRALRFRNAPMAAWGSPVL